MDITTVKSALEQALNGRRLLEHPFYRRWEAGELASEELARYAEQYRHLEQSLPTVLADTVAGLPEGPERELVAGALTDELGVPEAHAVLFESFASAAGAREDAPAGAAARYLVGLQRQAAEHQPLAALAMIAAYEVQAADIARTKSDGLRDHFGFDEAGTRFWDVHATMEQDHATWSMEALAGLGAEPEEITSAAATAASAWWSFLDERELAAAG